ncbi:MAG: phosphoribosylanthranilate isomerase [Myxococcota bacterium]|nr:phosphoribosylanthranilate isomerase [Myxococcota bacterium]
MSAPVRVKVCGVTRLEDALRAADAGADAIGLNFWEGSKRRCGLEVAAQIVSRLPPFVTPVAVFVNPTLAFVRSALDETGISVAQLHGDEDPETFSASVSQLIKAVRVAGPQWRADADRYARHTLLLDTASAGFGGSGSTFDWSLVRDAPPARPWILAGGLNAQNVAEAIRALRPAAVDVASGVESAPGIKDQTLLTRFIRAAKEA